MSDTDARPGGPQPGPYRHSVEALRKPWAIVRETFDTVCDIVVMRSEGNRLSDDEISARIGARRGQAAEPIDTGSVAVIPLYGVIYPKANLMTQVSGAVSVQEFQRKLRDAVADASVSSVLIDVDSPGGITDLVPELAEEIRQSRKVKPIVAVANTDAGSAAYWLAAQASELVVTPSGQVGSVGVFMAHVDRSGQMEREGLRHTIVSAGKFKVERAQIGPLSEEATAAMQGEVDEFYDMFVRAVAKGRGVGVDQVRQGFGEGRMVTASRALELGMVDRVETFDQTLSRLMRQGARPARASASATTTTASYDVGEHGPEIFIPLPAGSFTDETDDLRARALGLVNRARSLADVRERGRLTAAKREQFAACSAALRESAQAIEGLLADTDPERHQAALVAEEARLVLGETAERIR